MPYRSARHLLFALQLAALVAGLVLLFWPESVRGAAIHKCRDALGALHYQDAPCPAGTAVPLPPIAVEPHKVSVGEDVIDRRLDEGGARDEPAFGGEPPPRTPAPPLYACERYDGQERYVTGDPEPRRYQVPLWTVVANAGPAGAAYTWVEDRCRPMSTREQCERWRLRSREIQPERRRAFRDELERLDDELAGLRGRLAAHCG